MARKTKRLAMFAFLLLPLTALAQDFNSIQITTTAVRDGIYMM